MADGTWQSNLIGAACWSSACWLAGYGFALYRAVGWVERMRRWASKSVDVHEEECSGC